MGADGLVQDHVDAGASEISVARDGDYEPEKMTSSGASAWRAPVSPACRAEIVAGAEWWPR